jgi:hypothetical protein
VTDRGIAKLGVEVVAKGLEHRLHAGSFTILQQIYRPEEIIFDDLTAVRFAVHSRKHARIGSRIAPAKLFKMHIQSNDSILIASSHFFGFLSSWYVVALFAGRRRGRAPDE